MKTVSRNGRLIDDTTNQEKFLKLLYGTLIGRATLKFLTIPCLSKFAGFFLDSRPSSLLIDSFIKHNNITMSDYIPKRYKSFNDFFTRRIKPEKRPIDMSEKSLVSPADGRISVYKIRKHSVFSIKNTKYTLESILRNKELAKEYENGYFIIIRLSVDNYHRYCSSDNGKILEYHRIPGVLHTVNPIANDYFKIYKENSRTYSVIESENFGKLIQIEVGAILVGRIVNNRHHGTLKKGQEKGKFEYGGSTVILIAKDENVIIDNDLIVNTYAGYETMIKMGERIGFGK